MSVFPGLQNLTVNGTLNVVAGNQTNTTQFKHAVSSSSSIAISTSQQAATTSSHGHVIHSVSRATSKKSIPQLSKLFTGRNDILEQMAQYLDPSKSSIALKLQRIFALYGPGGAGKTQIMAKFVDEFGDQFSGVYYIDASTLEIIQSSFEDIVRNVGAGTTVDDALHWLSQHRRDWLLLIDSADDPDINMDHFLPPCAHGNIIIATRNPTCRLYGLQSNCNVSGMKPDEAVDLLLKSAVSERSNKNHGLAASICRELGYLALAVVQAGAYITHCCSLDNYLQLYLEDHAQLLQRHSIQTTDDYEWAVYTTWEMSLKKLSSTATMFLQLCAFMHYDGISGAIFQNAATADSGQETFREAEPFLCNLRSENGQWSSLKFLDLVDELDSYSLINASTENHVYAIHPLVHTWARQRASPEDCRMARTCILHILALSITDNRSADGFAFRRSLLPHVDRCRIGVLEHQVADKLQKLYVEALRCSVAEELQKPVIETRIRMLGKEHPDTLKGQANLALTYRKQGRWRQAEELNVQIVDARRRVLGDDHADTLASLVEMAFSFHIQGRLEECEGLERQLMEARRRLLGDEHPDTLQIMGNLGSTYSQQGRFKEAEELELQVMETRRRLLGDEHSDTILAMGNMAITYSEQGRLKETEVLLVSVLEAQRRRLGDQHPDTLQTMVILARTYKKRDQFKVAEKLELQVMEARRKLLGNTHPDTLRAIRSLASTYYQRDQLKEAEELQEEVVGSRRRLFGDEHPDTLRAKGDLACTYGKQGRLKESRELQLEVVKAQGRLLGDEHPDTSLTMANLAYTYSQQDRFKEAKEPQLKKRRLLVNKHHEVYGGQGLSRGTEGLGRQVLEATGNSLCGNNLQTLKRATKIAYTSNKPIPSQKSNKGPSVPGKKPAWRP